MKASPASAGAPLRLTIFFKGGEARPRLSFLSAPAPSRLTFFFMGGGGRERPFKSQPYLYQKNNLAKNTLAGAFDAENIEDW